MTSVGEKTRINQLVGEYLDLWSFIVADLREHPFYETVDRARIIIDNAPDDVTRSQDVWKATLSALTNRMIEVAIVRAEDRNIPFAHDSAYDEYVDRYARIELLAMFERTPELCAINNILDSIGLLANKFHNRRVFQIIMRTIVDLLFREGQYSREDIVKCIECMSYANGNADVEFCLFLLVTITSHASFQFAPFGKLYRELHRLRASGVHICLIGDLLNLIDE